jgi:hypothetical protein
MKKERSPKPMVIMPSTMKIQAQPGRPSRPLRFSIAAARRPPKEPEKAAAEKNMAFDMVNFFSMGRNWKKTYCSDTEFVPLVPARQEVINSREETCFSHS